MTWSNLIHANEYRSKYTTVDNFLSKTEVMMVRFMARILVMVE